MKRLYVALAFIGLVCGVNSSAEEAASTRKIVRQVAPAYPELARNTRTFGTVKLQVTVDRSGVPRSMEVIGGNPVLVRAAEESVDKWKWAPASAETTERVELRFEP